MNFSEKAIKNADSCRFCWMCHHICPVGNATGLERNTARARGLAISLVARGGAELTPDIVDNIYECTLCGGCTNDCITGWDPIVFTKQARTAAAMNGLLPDYIDRLLSNFEATGNVYGEKQLDKKLATDIAHHKSGDTLLFLGQDARCKQPKCARNAIAALEKLGVEFAVLSDEPDSGWALDTLIGATAETTAAMKKCAERLNEYKTVIVYDPSDMKAFLREYKEYGVKLTAKTVTFSKTLSDSVKKGGIKLDKIKGVITYQDPALLAREVEETQPAREIISECGKLKEMLLHGKETMFAGNLLMCEYLESTMKLIAAARWENVKSCGADTLVCASVSEYAVLKSVKPDKMSIKMLEQLVIGKGDK